MFQLLGILGLVTAVVWMVRRFRPDGAGAVPELRSYRFKLVLRDGRVATVSGTVPRAVYNAFEEVASMRKVTGEVRVSGGNQLAFSDTIPEPVQQQFRNVYHAGLPR